MNQIKIKILGFEFGGLNLWTFKFKISNNSNFS